MVKFTLLTKQLSRRSAFLLIALMLWSFSGQAQTGGINGKVTDGDQAPLAGASVLIKELNRREGTDVNGNYAFSNLPNGIYSVVVSFIGYQSLEKKITIHAGNVQTLDFQLRTGGEDLEEVMVVGYASVRKSDLTGAVSTVTADEFNQGPLVAPDQLIQGKVSGVQMINNSGQPGGGTTVQIRGSSAVTGSGQPLYIVDGVALDGRSARPTQSGGVGNSPAGNPLNFINPNDIESMEILKDASATAIYGARAAYGVVLITTKRGKQGGLKVDVNASTGTASMMRTLDVLNGDEYRSALNKYGLTTGDYGSNVNAMDAITRTGVNQNYNVSLSGGGEDSRFRTSAGYQKQEGIIRKTDFEKISGSFNGNFKMLESKRLGLDVSLIASQTNENVAPITTDAGFQGSLIGQALNWNPTRPLRNDDGSFNILRGETTVNPLGMLEAYNDKARVSTILGSLSPYYKITDWLEYRMLASVNYNTGIRRSSTRSWINITNIEGNPSAGIPGGYASYVNNELITTQLTHTLTFNKEVADKLNLNAVLGYEYMDFKNKGMNFVGRNYGDIDVDYTDALQANPTGNREISSFYDPSTELQSYFARAILNYDSRYLLTATIRRDGSTKFGVNTKYGNFPSFSAAWNISNESFFTPNKVVNALKLRAGWGKTGNQEFPSGAAIDRYNIAYGGGRTIYTPINNGNPDLKWQSDEQINVGVDFGLFNNRLTGIVDVFRKRTTDLLYPIIPSYPIAPGAASIWSNLDAQIENKGIEIALNASLIAKENVQWNLSGNVTFIDNMVKNLSGTFPTGSLNGQGLSSVTLEVIQSGYPMFAMMTREYLGLDEAGFSKYKEDGYTFFYLGNPNPRTLLGFSTDVSYKNLSFTANFNGLLGRELYNNTANSVLPITNLGTRNIASNLLEGSTQESLTNPIAASSRYIENGSYLKLANATINYRIGNVGTSLKNLNVFLNGTNLFVITKYTGFDPEVNVPKGVGGIPSAGIDYIAYPTARTFSVGVNFSL